VKLQSYKELEVWQRSITLVSEVYKVSRALPKSELFGLSCQIQRSAVSIPSNIAEGYARKGTQEYIRFLSMAHGSAAELDTQLIIINQEYESVELAEAQKLLHEVQRMLYAMMESLQRRRESLYPIS